MDADETRLMSLFAMWHASDLDLDSPNPMHVPSDTVTLPDLSILFQEL